MSREKIPDSDKSSGFTVVELLVTLIASAILIGSLSVAVNAQSAVSQRHRDMVLTNSFANSKVESLRSLGFLGLTDGTIDVTNELPDELQAPRSATLTISSQTVSVKRIVLTITYNDRGGERTYTYTTFIGELGVSQY